MAYMNRGERDVLLALKGEAIYEDPILDGFPAGEATVVYFAKIDEIAAQYGVPSIEIQREINLPAFGDPIRGAEWNPLPWFFGRTIRFRIDETR